MIIVVGAPRSGTTLTMSLLGATGGRILNTQNVMHGDFAELESVLDWAELKFNEDAVRAVLRPNRWHG